MADRMLTREELAEKLRHSVAWTYKNLPRLQREHGFPRAVLGHYSERAVDHWIQASSWGLAPAPEQRVTLTLEEDDSDTDARLAQRAKDLAQGTRSHGS